MKHQRYSTDIFLKWRVNGLGILLGVLSICVGPVWGQDRTDTSSGPSSPGSQNTEMDDSLLIGGGIHRPPDIGAAGTASPTPPVRTESPTDEPDLLPSQFPVPTDPVPLRDASPSTGEREVQPLGDPEFIKEPLVMPQ